MTSWKKNTVFGFILIGLGVFVLPFDFSSDAPSSELIVDSLDSDLVRIQRVVHYKGIPFDGVLKVSEPDGSMLETTFLNGKKHGVETSTYASGAIQFERQWRHGMREGNSESWWANGNRKSASFYAHDVLEGELTEWFSDGTPARVFHYAAGKEEGPQKMWFEDASIRANYLVIEGRRYGSIGTKGCESDAEGDLDV